MDDSELEAGIAYTDVMKKGIVQIYNNGNQVIV